MSAFRFPIQALLDIREAEERQAHRVLLSAARDLARERARAAQLRDERARITRSFDEANPRLATDVVRETFLRLELVAAASAQQSRAVARAREYEMTSRAAFAAARREHRRVAALRERAYAAHVDGLERREADGFDAANAAKHNATILAAHPFHN